MEKGDATAPARIPVIVVTGYLGSGKTTLIAKMLDASDMAGTAVIVNELAEIGIDQSVIGDVSQSDVVLLSNGCLCCGRGTDLSDTVRQLLARSRAGGPSLERILIETSGVADPAPIVRQICFDPQLRASLRYGGVLCLFDAAFGSDLLKRDPVGYRQIALADMVLVTKTDMAGSQSSTECAALLKSLNPASIVTDRKDWAFAFLNKIGSPTAKAGSQSWLGPAVSVDEGAHRKTIGTWTVGVEGPIDWARAELSLRSIYDRSGDMVLRTKGLIWTEDDPRPLVIHGINRHFHRPIRLKNWETVAQTRIVVIGFEGTEQVSAEIRDVLKACSVADKGLLAGPAPTSKPGN